VHALYRVAQACVQVLLCVEKLYDLRSVHGVTSTADTTTDRSDKSSENRIAFLLRSPFRQARDRFRDVLPKIPEPKNPPRENVVSLRFSDMEKEKLDKACEMYATYWNKKHVGHAELIRAAVEMMYDVMQQSGRQESK